MGQGALSASRSRWGPRKGSPCWRPWRSICPTGDSEFRVNGSSLTSIAHQPVALVNARLIDPAGLIETAAGVLVVDGLIRDFGAAVMPANLPDHARIIDCGGDCVAPGLIDMWAFIGEPGAGHRAA